MNILDRARAILFRPRTPQAALPAPTEVVAEQGHRLEFSAGPVVASWPAYGKLAGYLDPNREVMPQDLYGMGNRQLGQLFRMRHAHPVIGAAMDFARREMESLTYELEPADDSALSKAAAVAVAEAFERMPGWSLPRWVAHTVDAIRTYGYCLYETRSNGGDLWPFYVAPHLLDSWWLKDSYTEIDYASIYSGGALAKLYMDRASWYGLSAAPGNYYGIAELRKLLALFAAYEQDLQMYLDQQRLARGILYLEQTTEIAPSQTSVNAAVEWLLAYHRGEDRPFVAPYGLKPAVVTVQNPTIAEFGNMLEKYNVQFREALMSSLGSLGISGDGARALGEEFRIVDAQRFRSAVESYLAVVNGQTSRYSDFLVKLTLDMGYPAECTPRIVTRDNTGTDAAANRADLVAMVGAGILSRTDLSADSLDRLIRSLGLEPASAAEPDDGDGDGNEDAGIAVGEPLIQTRANRIPSDVRTRIMDGLIRVTPDVHISPDFLARVRAWAMGEVPTDDDVRAAMQWLSGPDAASSLAARAGTPEWLLAQLWGGRAGAAYWAREARRRGV